MIASSHSLQVAALTSIYSLGETFVDLTPVKVTR